MSPNGFCNSSVKQCTKLIKMEEKKYPIVGYAPGNYQCKCCDCGESFLGDKRAVQCEPCAIATKEKFDALSPDEQKELMERNAEAIREAFKIGGKKCNCNEPYDSEKHGSGYPYCPVHDKRPEINHDRVISNQIAGMPLEEAIFQDGYSAGVEFEKRRSKTGAVWVKANSPDIKNGEYVAKFKAPGIKLKHDFVGMAFVDDQFVHFVCPCHYDLKWAKGHEELQFVTILDESAPSGERDPYAGFRETIENIIHSAGKHNQEQCTEIADAILRDLSIGLYCQKKKSPSGEREVDAVAFHDWVLKNEYVIDNRAEHTHTTAQLYGIFKQQKEG